MVAKPVSLGLFVFVLAAFCAACSPSATPAIPAATRVVYQEPSITAQATSTLQPVPTASDTPRPTGTLRPTATPIPQPLVKATVTRPPVIPTATSIPQQAIQPSPTPLPLPTSILLGSIMPWDSSGVPAPRCAASSLPNNDIGKIVITESPTEMRITADYTYKSAAGDTLFNTGLVALALQSNGVSVPGTQSYGQHLCMGSLGSPGNGRATVAIRRVTGNEAVTSTSVLICMIHQAPQPKQFYCETFPHTKTWLPAPTDTPKPARPPAPTNVGVAASSPTQVRVSWRDASTNELGFRVYRVMSPSQTTLVATVGPGASSGSTQSATIGGLACGAGNYQFYVKAYNSAGESAASPLTTGSTQPCTVRVDFTSVRIYDDEDPLGSGELWFSFNVNNITRRFPASGTLSADSGDTRAISGISVPLSLMRTQNLVIAVKGTDTDSPDPDDPLGTASATYTGANNWSAGSHCTESVSPHDFKICYNISVTP